MEDNQNISSVDINIINDLISRIDNDIQNSSINFPNIIVLIDNLLNLTNVISQINNHNIVIDDYNEKLKSLLNAFEEKDYILFNDILQYELKPMFDFWKENIN